MKRARPKYLTPDRSHKRQAPAIDLKGQKFHDALADALAMVPIGCTRDDLETVTERVADIMGGKYPGFNRKRFIERASKEDHDSPDPDDKHCGAMPGPWDDR